MKKWSAGIGAIVLLVFLHVDVAAASTTHNSSSMTHHHPRGCKKVSFTAAGGYYSSGHFYTEPSDTYTVHTKWCYAGDVITSYQVTFRTTIPSSLNPRISKSVTLNSAASVLTIGLNGDFDSGVLNNVSVIGIAGDVNSVGGHDFTNTSGAGG